MLRLLFLDSDPSEISVLWVREDLSSFFVDFKLDSLRSDKARSLFHFNNLSDLSGRGWAAYIQGTCRTALLLRTCLLGHPTVPSNTTLGQQRLALFLDPAFLFRPLTFYTGVIAVTQTRV